MAVSLDPPAGDSGTTLDTSNHFPGPSTNPRKAARRASQSSLTGKRRNGSISSSQRSHRIQTGSLGAGSQSAAPGTSPVRPEKKKTKKGGPSRFLSFLSCCGGGNNTSEIDMDERSVPVRRSSKLQVERPNQNKTQDISGAESSTADESKDISVEKIGGPPYSDLKSAGEPKVQESAKPASAPKASSPHLPTNDIKTSSNSRSAEKSTIPQIQHSTLSKEVPSEATDPISAPLLSNGAPTASLQEDGSVNTNQEAQQENVDGDVNMPDAPALHAVTVDTSQDTGDNKTDSTPPLPPPPPVSPVRHESTSSTQPERVSNNLTNVPNERQKWLLPPIRPEFKGKKCLVLDLDETLVHSSFKVSLG